MTQAKLSQADLENLATVKEVIQAERKGLITSDQADERIEQIEHEEQTAAYSVKLGTTGKFYVSGPSCSQSLHAGQALGILSVASKIKAIAKQHAKAKPRTETLENKKGEEYSAVYCGDVNCGPDANLLRQLAQL